MPVPHPVRPRGGSAGERPGSSHRDDSKVGRLDGPTACGQCGQGVRGQFVRAMGKVYHLQCFRCKDCDKVVAQKFFPIEEADGMHPLCERDYFARLGLICGKCDQALRSSYITACGNKYHVEHFTCSECDVLFGPNDSYYEHGGKVYCHFHYSTRFAVKCVGCETAILKQFVEMNRNGRDECWHPECYMISKFWNVRLASKSFNTPANSAVSSAVSLLEMTPTSNATTPASELELTPEQLKEKQDVMERKVQQIWHVLSSYEESSAALIGDMLRAVNGRQLLEIILLAERFILYVEVLFAAIDDLEAQFALAGVKGMSHAREAKHLCRRLVNLLSAMSAVSPNTEELFNLITQLAHYLKILIRVALTGAIKLERDLGNPTAMSNCLARLNLLAMDNGDPTVQTRGNHPPTTNLSTASDEEQLQRNIDSLTRQPQGYIPSTQNIAYGYRSLALEITGESTLRGSLDEDTIPSEGCGLCKQPVEEDCVRLGMFTRWHPACLICIICGDKAGAPLLPPKEPEEPSEDAAAPVVKKRTPPRVDDFFYELPDNINALTVPETILCVIHRTPTAKNGFKGVSRLEQYAFLLHIALRRLYVHFRVNHDLPSVRGHTLDDAADVKRVKSVTLDRKLSYTARLPQRSTVVESPAGRMADENGQVVSARGSANGHEPLNMEDTAGPSVDVIRPPFARNNTSIMIINENAPGIDHLPSIDDDALTLGDIPLLATQTRDGTTQDGRPLLSLLNPVQSLIVKHFALLQLQKTPIGHLVELDEILELLDTRKNQWWNKIFKGPNKKDQKKKGTFGVPIEILVERTGSDSQQGASNAHLRVPEFIEDIISTMRQMDMAIEGIFRKNGNIRRLQQVADALDKDPATVNLSEENPVQLAALLKRWLRELPDPLLTFRLHRLFCAAASLQNRDDRHRCLHLLITLLPRYNRDTMEVLFVFLKWVGTFSYRDEETGSRMDMANLATVICPSILYAKGANAARDESFIAIEVVQELLENQDDYYRVPHDLMFVINENIFNIFTKELDLPPKEIHRHCQKYMQARTEHRRMFGPGFGREDFRRHEGIIEPTPHPNGSRSHATIAGSSRPTSWAQISGSQQSLNANMNSPGGAPWRGPFQGSANGSRNSSRGSAPSSPGPDGERRSIQLERDRSWTPVLPSAQRERERERIERA
ncbi:hypothetical protein BD324DRAFT_576998 [Kockovaella imperatae]|uniref:Rho GTPase activator n=1 Tax=Kockovaella imperatae TaxID=4999 RepID=A0A1Y1UM18_9TREE|nr:hypothetical protein BD324DRAFT_576998 [Kockovaella imperatae]ORX39091.1 hypothetical protein BD324DRAFT_576998 [Kockovaella imperatae]